MSRRLVFGTDDRCDVIIEQDPYVSLRHCEVWRDERGRVMVQDLGSTNGTYLSTEKGPAVRVYGPTWMTPGQNLWLGARTVIPWQRVHSLVEQIRP